MKVKAVCKEAGGESREIYDALITVSNIYYATQIITRIIFSCVIKYLIARKCDIQAIIVRALSFNVE